MTWRIGELVRGQVGEAQAGIRENLAQTLRLGCAQPDGGIGEATGDGLERALGAQPPVGDDHHVVDGLCHFGQQVGGDQHGLALSGQVAHEVAEPGDPLGVQAVGGLVEDEDARVADQRAGQFEALAHAEGEAADLALGVTLQADELERGVHPGVGLATGPGHGPQCRSAPAGRGGSWSPPTRRPPRGRGWAGDGRAVRRWWRSRRSASPARAACEGWWTCRSVRSQEPGDLPGSDGECTSSFTVAAINVLIRQRSQAANALRAHMAELGIAPRPEWQASSN